MLKQRADLPVKLERGQPNHLGLIFYRETLGSGLLTMGGSDALAILVKGFDDVRLVLVTLLYVLDN